MNPEAAMVSTGAAAADPDMLKDEEFKRIVQAQEAAHEDSDEDDEEWGGGRNKGKNKNKNKG